MKFETFKRYKKELDDYPVPLDDKICFNKNTNAFDPKFKLPIYLAPYDLCLLDSRVALETIDKSELDNYEKKYIKYKIRLACGANEKKDKDEDKGDDFQADSYDNHKKVCVAWEDVSYLIKKAF